MGFFGFLHGLKEWLQKALLIDSSSLKYLALDNFVASSLS
jgi:hypothetical protein